MDFCDNLLLCNYFVFQFSVFSNMLSTINESGSILSPSDISYDKTEEDLDGIRHNGRNAKRPSAPPGDDDNEAVPSGKRSRRAAVTKTIVSEAGVSRIIES